MADRDRCLHCGDLGAVGHRRGPAGRALRLIGADFAALALNLLAQPTVVLVAGFHPHHSPLGIVWPAVSAVMMFVLALAKVRIGVALANSVPAAEGRVTFIDGVLAAAVLLGMILNATAG